MIHPTAYCIRSLLDSSASRKRFNRLSCKFLSPLFFMTGDGLYKSTFWLKPRFNGASLICELSKSCSALRAAAASSSASLILSCSSLSSCCSRSSCCYILSSSYLIITSLSRSRSWHCCSRSSHWSIPWFHLSCSSSIIELRNTLYSCCYLVTHWSTAWSPILLTICLMIYCFSSSLAL